MDRLIKMLVLFSTIVLLTNLVSGERRAVCKVVKGSGTGPVSGTIELSQPAAGTYVTLKIALQNLTVPGTRKHGFHVHANASLDNSCNAAAGHLNVLNTAHGAPTDDRQHRHTGDLGNVDTDANGVVSLTITDWLISLHDEDATNVIGKPIVVHELVDDLGKGGAPTSNTTGNAGLRLGCCIIELTGNKSSPMTTAVSAWVSLVLAFCILIGQDVFSCIN